MVDKILEIEERITSHPVPPEYIPLHYCHGKLDFSGSLLSYTKRLNDFLLSNSFPLPGSAFMKAAINGCYSEICIQLADKQKKIQFDLFKWDSSIQTFSGQERITAPLRSQRHYLDVFPAWQGLSANDLHNYSTHKLWSHCTSLCRGARPFIDGC